MCPVAPLAKEPNRSKLPHLAKLPYFMLQGGRGFPGCVHMQKKFFGPQNLETFVFFVQKKLLHCDCHLLGGTVDNFRHTTVFVC